MKAPLSTAELKLKSICEFANSHPQLILLIFLIHHTVDSPSTNEQKRAKANSLSGESSSASTKNPKDARVVVENCKGSPQQKARQPNQSPAQWRQQTQSSKPAATKATLPLLTQVYLITSRHFPKLPFGPKSY